MRITHLREQPPHPMHVQDVWKRADRVKICSLSHTSRVRGNERGATGCGNKLKEWAARLLQPWIQPCTWKKGRRWSAKTQRCPTPSQKTCPFSTRRWRGQLVPVGLCARLCTQMTWHQCGEWWIGEGGEGRCVWALLSRSLSTGWLVQEVVWFSGWMLLGVVSGGGGTILHNISGKRELFVLPAGFHLYEHVIVITELLTRQDKLQRCVYFSV